MWDYIYLRVSVYVYIAGLALYKPLFVCFQGIDIFLEDVSWVHGKFNS